MARYYHPGPSPDIDPPTHHHPTLGRCIRAPQMFWPLDPLTGQPTPRFVQAQPNSICVTVLGHGFYVVPPKMPDGSPGYVDLPDYLTEDAVKSMAPHLLSATDALMAGLPIASASPLRPPSTPAPPEPAPQQKRRQA